MAADHLFELDADLLALATELEGHPDNVAAALLRRVRRLRRRRARRASTPPAGLEARAGRARTSRSAPREARAALPAEVPMADAVFNVGHASLLTLGLAQRRLGPRRARPARPPAPAPPRAPVPALGRSSSSARRELGALGATISGAGPTVLVWCHCEQTRRGRRARCGARAEGWADVVRVPFEPRARTSASSKLP